MNTPKQYDWHLGRHFGGAGKFEETCPCPKQPCGLVRQNEADPECTQHAVSFAKTMRTIHTHEDCPSRG